MSSSLGPCGLHPTRLLCLWDSPGKNTGEGCHALLQGSSRPRDGTHLSYTPALAGTFFTSSATWEALSQVQGRSTSNRCHNLKVFQDLQMRRSHLNLSSKFIDITGETCNTALLWLSWPWKVFFVCVFFFKFNLIASEKLQHNQLKSLRDQFTTDLFHKQISLNLAIYGRSKGNFKEKKDVLVNIKF